MREFAFPRRARLCEERQFRRVYRQGKRINIRPLRFCLLRNKGDGSRLGLAVGRRVGAAVVRNRWKRAVREAFRLNRHELNASHDIVVSVDWNASPGEVERVEGAFRELIRRLNETEAGE